MSKIKNIYIIGIGGISLSAIAVLLRDMGYIVKGSDTCGGERFFALKNRGFDVVEGHSPEFVYWADEIIISSAIAEDDPDVLLAKSLNKKIVVRAQALGELSKKYDTISVAGCHGKTTVTGMISSVFLLSKDKPNIHIGGILKQIQDNVFEGTSRVFITEACEYKDSFLFLDSKIGVILNIKPDHLDYFLNFENVKKSFCKFAQNVKDDGLLVLNGDDVECIKLKTKIQKNILTFGIENNCDVKAFDCYEHQAGKYSFKCKLVDGDMTINLPVYGKHNVYNALATICVCKFLGVANDVIKEGLESFQGIARRFDKVYEDENKLIIHDYAHHPDEIEASILAGRELGKKELVVIFQPHTFSRTRDFFDGFVTSLLHADEVWLLPIYPAREKPLKGITSFKIYENLKEKGVKTQYFSQFSQVYQKILKMKKNCLFLILGAGDIENLAKMFEI